MSTSEPLTASEAARKPPRRPRRKRPVAQRSAMLYPRAWPRALTGCVSALSICRCHSTTYRDALKSYGELCSAAVHTPTGSTIPHDYEALGTPLAPGDVGGCLTPELAESLVRAAAIDDDDIEFCGYLGWLHR